MLGALLYVWDGTWLWLGRSIVVGAGILTYLSLKQTETYCHVTVPYLGKFSSHCVKIDHVELKNSFDYIDYAAHWVNAVISYTFSEDNGEGALVANTTASTAEI